MWKGYWPNAVVLYHGRIKRMFTYGPCDTLEKAKHVIDCWNNVYDNGVVCSYVEHSWDRKRVCCKFHEDTLRRLEYADKL